MKTKAPNQFAIAIGLTRYAIKSTLRNKASYFFSLIFPLIFVSVFGLIGNSSNSSIKLGVTSDVNTNAPIYQAIEKLSKLDNAPVTLVTGTKSDLEEQLNKSKVAAVLEPDGATASITLATSSSNPSGAGAATSFMNGITSQLNLKAAGVTSPTFSYQTIDLAGRKYNYIDFLLPGMIGFSLLSIATFGIAFPLITLRKTLVLKRMFATTVRPITFVVSQCLARSVQAVLQAAIILAVGVWGFHFNLANGFTTAFEMLVMAFLGILAFLGFGILIGNIARDETSLPIAINLFTLPQMLLAGVFFSTDTLPKWAQYIGNNLPLAYLNTALRNIANDGAGFLSPGVWHYIVGLIGWGVVAYFAASRIFKSE